MKLQLVKTEASWIQTRVGCYVSLDSQLLDVITPLNSPHESPILDIPPEGTLRLIFKDMGKIDGYIASVSVPLHLFTQSCTLWLPLFSNSSIDILNSLPSETHTPRIQVGVLTNESFNICDDELFQSFSEIHIETEGEVVVASQILPISSAEPELCKTSTFKLQKGVGYVEKLVLQLKKYKILAAERKSLAMSYREKCMELESKLSVQENKLIEILEVSGINAEKNHAREMDYLEAMRSQQEEIISLQGTVFELSASLREAQHSNFYITENSRVEEEEQCEGLGGEDCAVRSKWVERGEGKENTKPSGVGRKAKRGQLDCNR